MNFDFIFNPNLLSFYIKQGFYYSAQFFLSYGVWILLSLIVLRIIWKHWTNKNKKKYLAKQKYVFLGVSMPKDNEQGPEAVERFFVHLAGIREKFTWYEKNIQGKRQLNISLEIASIGGQIKFFIYTPVQFRDLVESAIYTSYPNLEIFEQNEDYTDNGIEGFLEDRYNIWGADLKLSKQNPIPIKTYPESEHQLTKELKDPLIDLLEVLGRLRQSEQIWLQFIITPIGSELKEEGEKLIKNISLGKNISKRDKDNIVDKIVFSIMKFGQDIVEFIEEVLNLHPTLDKFGDKEEKPFSSPSDKRLIEAIQNKISKIAFKSCVRIVYVADKEIFAKDRGITGILGAFNAFKAIDLNSFEVSPVSKVYEKNWKGNKILDAQKQEVIKAYKGRDFNWRARIGISKIIFKIKKFLTLPERSVEESILNTEELATLYHFPVNMIKASLIKKTSSKKAEPPLDLPVK